MSDQDNKPLGISGRIAKQFLQSEITLLLALLGLFLGLFAIMVTPREEEPQINVTFANVFIAYPGASAREVESLVSVPAEQVLSEIEGIKHVYSVSRPGMSYSRLSIKSVKIAPRPLSAFTTRYFPIVTGCPRGWALPSRSSSLKA